MSETTIARRARESLLGRVLEAQGSRQGARGLYLRLALECDAQVTELKRMLAAAERARDRARAAARGGTR
jgi:hypothetical protein